MGHYLALLGGIAALLFAVPAVNEFVFSMENPAYGLLNIGVYLLLAVLLLLEGRVADKGARKLKRGEKKVFWIRLLSAVLLIGVNFIPVISRHISFLFSIIAASVLILRLLMMLILNRKKI